MLRYLALRLFSFLKSPAYKLSKSKVFQNLLELSISDKKMPNFAFDFGFEAKNASHSLAIFIFYNLINRYQCPFF